MFSKAAFQWWGLRLFIIIIFVEQTVLMFLYYSWCFRNIFTCDLVCWVIKDLENNEKTAQNYTEELVNNQKRSGTTVTKITTSIITHNVINVISWNFLLHSVSHGSIISMMNTTDQIQLFNLKNLCLHNNF